MTNHSFKKLAVLLLFSFVAAVGRTQEFTGATLTYSWIADSTYNFQLKVYSPCADTPYALPATAQLCYINPCDNSSGYFIVQGMPQTTLLPPYFKEYIYEGSFTVPAKCDDWTFYATVPQRKPTVNMVAGGNLYVEATMNNLYTDTISSPLFAIPPTSVVYLNEPAIILNGPFDPDQDSIVSEMVQPRTADGSIFGGCNMNAAVAHDFAAFPLTAGNPFLTGGSVPFNINSTTGTLTFSLANAAMGYDGYAVRINKYRRSDGVKLGSVVRDAQFRAIASPFNPPGITGGVALATVTGAMASGNVIDGYAGAAFHFCIYGAKNPLSTGILSVSDNFLTVLPNATVSYHLQDPDSMSACFSYTPTIADTGTYNFLFTIKDSIITGNTCDDMPMDITLKQYMPFQLRIHEAMNVNSAGSATESIRIYPNPASDKIYLSGRGLLRYMISTADGKLVLDGSTGEADISGLADGLYIIKVFNEEGGIIVTEKLIKASR
jgi:hypothetical protein